MNALARYTLVFVPLTTIGCTPSSVEESIPHTSEEAQSTPSAAGQSPSQETMSVAESSVIDAENAETPEQAADALPSTEAEPRPTPSLDELLLFFPSKHPAGNWNPQGLDFEDVWFTAEDDTRIHGWYCPCRNARAFVLYAHGNAGNLSHRSRLLARLQSQMRVAVLIFDYRGYGRSEGIPTVDGILDDARAARAFLAQHAGVEESDIVLMGRSLGGAVATQLAAESKPRGLILESTFSSLKDVALEHYARLAWLVPPQKLDCVSQIARYHGPLLQSHGNADRTIPFSLGKKLFDAAKEPKQFVTIPHADHNDPQSADYYKQLDRFLETLPNN